MSEGWGVAVYWYDMTNNRLKMLQPNVKYVFMNEVLINTNELQCNKFERYKPHQILNPPPSLNTGVPWDHRFQKLTMHISYAKVSMLEAQAPVWASQERVCCQTGLRQNEVPVYDKCQGKVFFRGGFNLTIFIGIFRWFICFLKVFKRFRSILTGNFFSVIKYHMRLNC